MFQSNIEYKEYLKKLKKSDLLNIINDYNELCDIYNYEKITITKDKKEELINLLNNVKDNYLKEIIMSLDKKDYFTLKQLFKKCSVESLNDNRNLINYLKDKHILWINNTLEIPSDLYIKNLLKDKTILKHISYWDNVYKYINGILVAYGALDKAYFNTLIKNVKEYDKVLIMLKFYYKKEYIINEYMVFSNKLTNKKRIDKYSKNKKRKTFTQKEFIDLGASVFHHNIKSYKKLIKLLKNYYVFKKKDIKFVDVNIVMPYLYNKINEEKEANIILNETIINLFEFKGEKLKERLLKEIESIREEFPLWELGGYSKMERDKK